MTAGQNKFTENVERAGSEDEEGRHRQQGGDGTSGGWVKMEGGADTSQGYCATVTVSGSLEFGTEGVTK